MILSYKQQFPWGSLTNFKNKIINGDKKHTIRFDTPGRWKAGNKIHHAHGVRTANYDCFLESECISVQKIEIEDMAMVDAKHCYVLDEYSEQLNETFFKIFRVAVDDRNLTTEEIHLLAKNDGFDSTSDFFRWFSNNTKAKIIHWTDFKY